PAEGSGRALPGAVGGVGPARVHAHRRAGHAGTEERLEEALARGGEGFFAGGREDRCAAGAGPGQRRGDRRPQGGGGERLVRGAAFGDRGCLQSLCGELPRGGALAADRGGGSGDRGGGAEVRLALTLLFAALPLRAQEVVFLVR